LCSVRLVWALANKYLVRFGGMKLPPWPEVHGQVSAWIERTRELTRCDPVALPEVLAALHVRFEQIHPFLDGTDERDGWPSTSCW